ncbi:HD domain-containing phosphohydrolase [Paludibacterium yongneupense]|uniref:response regulator n=1 Tax=Paludibacterium yongneupense TaxID=400061 RepID=UPI00042335ED|nr:HD domain-containing phosphohydrolase [Paludibacterium yongneupense]
MIHGPILLVDDEPNNLALLRQILGDHYPLVFARNGMDALAAAAKHRPALILLDIQMPDMNGFDVCRRLKSDPQTEATPVIFISSMAEVGDETAGFAAGCVDYIVKPVSPALVLARVRTHLSLVRATELEQSHRDAIHMLGVAGHYNDNDTGMHIWRMAAYSRALAEATGWRTEDAILLELAAPMHDTGKLGTPDAILRKPGPLTECEWDVMRMHSRIGYDILAQSSAPVFRLAATVALHHHEKWNGSGYPAGLAGGAIPESARIVAIADVFDALTMKRPYKDAWPLEKVWDTIAAGAGLHFEPRLVEHFMAIQPLILEIKQRWDRLE